MRTQPDLHFLSDDGLVPNNPALPLVVYRGVLETNRAETAQHVLAHFASHGWDSGWINGIYDFHHYHSNAHEVLGIASGRAKVQFGGPRAPVLDVAAGDVVIIPAGVAHCRCDADPTLSVVGAYPRKQRDVDLIRATPGARVDARARIARVPLPKTDPVFGPVGPLLDLWRRPAG